MIAGFPFASREFVEMPIEIDPTLYRQVHAQAIPNLKFSY